MYVGVLDDGLERVEASAGHVAETVDEDVNLDVVGANLKAEVGGNEEEVELAPIWRGDENVGARV